MKYQIIQVHLNDEEAMTFTIESTCVTIHGAFRYWMAQQYAGRNSPHYIPTIEIDRHINGIIAGATTLSYDSVVFFDKRAGVTYIVTQINKYNVQDEMERDFTQKMHEVNPKVRMTFTWLEDGLCRVDHMLDDINWTTWLRTDTET